MIIGLDEVGRGALAGPVLVGAVGIADPSILEILLAECGLKALKDSKKLSKAQRQCVAAWADGRVKMATGRAEAAEVDLLGLSAALRLAAGRALEAVSAAGVLISEVLADAGLFHPFETEIPTTRYVKGDENFSEISLASIVAKVERDAWMADLELSYPGYGFPAHVGYGTPQHYAAIARLGTTREHRQLFLSGGRSGVPV